MSRVTEFAAALNARGGRRVQHQPHPASAPVIVIVAVAMKMPAIPALP